jgi:hypothetical protein
MKRISQCIRILHGLLSSDMVAILNSTIVNNATVFSTCTSGHVKIFKNRKYS